MGQIDDTLSPDTVIPPADPNVLVEAINVHKWFGTSKVLDGPNSVVFDEAENRLHAQKAVMALTMS